MNVQKKTAQLIMRITEVEKEFLIRKAEEENRTISAIVNIALREKYEQYKEISLGVKKDND